MASHCIKPLTNVLLTYTIINIAAVSKACIIVVTMRGSVIMSGAPGEGLFLSVHMAHLQD